MFGGMKCASLLALGALFIAACGGAPPPPPPKKPAGPVITGATEGPFKPQAKLQWMPDGAWLLVDGHLRFEPANGQFSPINGARADDIPILGPEGQRAYVDADQVRLPEGVVALPNWLEGAEPVGAAGYWLDADRIYVQQFGASSATCRVLKVSSAEWRTPSSPCLDPGQWQVEALQPGPGYLVHTYAKRDGAPDVRILRYDPRQGQGETLLVIRAETPPTVTFTPDGGRARVVTDCAQPDGTCGGAPTLYEFDLFDGTQKVVGPVAAGAVPAPVGDTLAWIHHGALCLGAPGGPIRCHAP